MQNVATRSVWQQPSHVPCQFSHKNRSPDPVWNFGFTEPQYSDKFAAEVPYLSHW